MANTKKTSTKTAEVAATPVGMEQENAALKAQLEELKAQMALLMQNVASAQPTAAKPSKRRIRIYNMTPSTLILHGSTYHSIEGQFAFADFLESEAVQIVTNMPNAVRNGVMYIADAQFIADNDLDTIYEKMLSKEQLEDLLTKDSAQIVSVYKSASKGQQDIIVDMLTTKRLNGERIDANVLQEIGELCGKDLLGVQPFAE